MSFDDLESPPQRNSGEKAATPKPIETSAGKAAAILTEAEKRLAGFRFFIYTKTRAFTFQSLFFPEFRKSVDTLRELSKLLGSSKDSTEVRGTMYVWHSVSFLSSYCSHFFQI